MKFPVLKTFITATACLTLFPTLAAAVPRVVNCDDGDSLQKALDAGAGSAAPTEIFVTGTCYEDPRIRRDRVSLNGDGFTVIEGRIRAFGDQLTIRDLKVTDGISFRHSRARLFDVQIVDNGDGFGMLVADNSSVSCDSCTISGNREGIRIEASHVSLSDTDVDFNDSAGEYSDGILVLQNSSLTSDGGSISNNGNLGLRVNWNSSIQVTGTEIASNGAYGILLQLGSIGALTDAKVTGNTGYGVEVSGGNAALEVFGGKISTNGSEGVWATEHSFVRLTDTEVSHNNGHGVALARDSGAVISGSTQVRYNTPYHQLVCQGDESSIDVEGGADVGPIDCSDQDF